MPQLSSKDACAGLVKGQDSPASEDREERRTRIMVEAGHNRAPLQSLAVLIHEGMERIRNSWPDFVSEITPLRQDEQGAREDLA